MIISEDVPLVGFMCLVYTCMAGESYCRWLWSLLLCLCGVFWALINSLCGLILITEVFIKCESLFVQIILSMQTHTHTGTHTYEHTDYTKLNLHNIKREANGSSTTHSSISNRFINACMQAHILTLKCMHTGNHTHTHPHKVYMILTETHTQLIRQQPYNFHRNAKSKQISKSQLPPPSLSCLSFSHTHMHAHTHLVKYMILTETHTTDKATTL